MKKRNIIILLAFVYLTLPLSAQWVWTSEEGWVSSDYSDVSDKKFSKTIENGKKLLDQGKVKEAVDSFTIIRKLAPESKEGKEATLLLADIEYTREFYYRAYVLYEDYLDKEPSSERLQDIILKEYECGRYVIAKREDNDDDVVPREKGVDILRTVITRSKHADFADDAQMLIANYYYDMVLYDEAITEYKSLIKEYPKSEWAPSAHYLLSECHEKKYRGEEHEVEPLVEASQRIDRYIEQFPDHKYIEKAEIKRKELLEKIVLKDIAVAEFYIRREKYHSARIYLQYVIKKYPKTRAIQKAKLLLKDLPMSNQ